MNGHKDFGYVASSDEVWNANSINNLNYLSDILKLLEHRFQLFRQDITGTSNLRPPDNWKSNYSYTPFNFFAEKDLLANHAEKKRKTLKRGKRGLDRFKQEYSYEVIREMKKMTESRGVELVFLYLPSYGTGLSKPKEYDFFTEQGHVLLPPEEIFNNENNWVDGEHLNYRGSKLLCNWLAKKLER